MIKQLSFWKRSPLLASPESLAAFEREFELRLPPALREFCSRWNGGFPSNENSFYYVPPEFMAFHDEYGPQEKGVTVDGLYGFTQDPRRCNLEKQYLSLGEVSATGLIPISFDLLGNQVVLRVDSLGGSVFWRDHELWEAPERPHLIPIAKDLEFFYNSLAPNPFSKT